MKISKTFISYTFSLLLGMMLLSLGSCASKKSIAGTSPAYTGKDARTAVIADALARYTQWESARISGKLHLDALPVSPSIKIYMKNGEEIQLSASAILVGEVLRAELTPDSLLIVNKMKKTYCKESASKLQEVYPTGCGELQSFLLGRMIVPGSGELSPSNISKTSIEILEDMRKVSPSLDEFPLALSLYYLINKDGQISEMILDGEAGKRFGGLRYDWKGNSGVDIEATVKMPKNNIEFELDLDAPKWGGEPLPTVNIGKNYRRVSLKEVVKF
ncbi:MAG: DUF4292 domain-containing protein [Muribaculaceae bacterium]|nr:DUF4292 domain-containing protein [Muribaculaceae bacterium]